MCKGLRGHQRLKDAMAAEFELEYARACSEHERLSALFRDVCWYNFETVCRCWRSPWYESFGGSSIRLHGVRVQGQWSEKTTFPVYYSGTIRDAPALPPQLVLCEVQEAFAYKEFMEQQRFAPYEWAPGGARYERLLRTSEGVAAFARLRDNNLTGCNSNGHF